MTSDSSPKAGSPALRQEIRSILEDDGTAEDLASQLDFSNLSHWDEYASWHPSTPFEPMVRLHFYRCLYDWSHEKAALYTDDPASRTNLGFSDSVSRPTVSRAWRNRFHDKLQHTLQRHAKAVTQVAEELGHPLAIEIVEPETKGTSKSTESRLVRKYLKEVPQTIIRMVQSNLNFLPKRAENAQYSFSQFWDIESRIGLANGAIEDGCKQYRISNEGEGPGGDIFRHYLKQNSLDDLFRRFQQANRTIVEHAKHRLDFTRPVDVAIDITPVPYYGKVRRDEYIIEAPPEKSYPYQMEFAAICVIKKDVRVFLGFRRRKDGESVANVVRELLDEASQLVNVRRVYADREFDSAGVIDDLNSRPLIYDIPVRRNSRIRGDIAKMKRDVEVEDGYGFYGETLDGESTKERVETTRALIPSSKNPSKTIPFYTNEDINDDSKVNREWAEIKLNEYRYRWGIETAFKSVKQFLPVTSSNDDRVRVFHFGFAVTVYNLWRLIDYLVRKEVRGEIDYGKPPLVTAGQFRECLRSYTGFA